MHPRHLLMPLSLLAGLAAADLHAAALPELGTAEFAVMRKGERIGTHQLVFSRGAEGIDLSINTDIVVKIAFVPVYRFEHKGVETWSDKGLVALKSKTNDDGTKHELAIRRDGDKLVIQGDGKLAEAAPNLFTGSLWSGEVPHQQLLLNTLDGSRMSVQIVDKGEETIEAAGRPTPVRHYVIDGDLKRNVWYDAAGHLVQMTLNGKDGSEVLYHLVRCDYCTAK